MTRWLARCERCQEEAGLYEVESAAKPYLLGRDCIALLIRIATWGVRS